MTKAAAELRELNDTELEHRLGEAKEELFNLSFQNATGQLGEALSDHGSADPVVGTVDHQHRAPNPRAQLLHRHADGVVASFVVGGREVSYQFNVGSLLNPLVLPALREFRCPTGI